MSNRSKIGAVTVALLTLVAVPVWAQTPAAPPPAPTPGVQVPPPAAPGALKTVEGSVRKVDPVARTISVSSGWLGFLFSKTIEIAPDTQITMAGHDTSLAAIREGTQVRASYETHDGKMVATRVEVLPSRT